MVREPLARQRVFQDSAFFPLTLTARQIDDYREKGGIEQQYCVYLRNRDSLDNFSKSFANDLEMFEALESVDISDLIRWVQVWVTRKDDLSGDISFGDLSDGERQLLMVLGLVRLSRGKKALFLLDEPDTHLNPAWQHRFLELIRAWVQADSADCQFIIATHHPLTIAALNKEEVRVMFADSANKISVNQPYTDPRGMGSQQL
jgi:predicted ATPase